MSVIAFVLMSIVSAIDNGLFVNVSIYMFKMVKICSIVINKIKK